MFFSRLQFELTLFSCILKFYVSVSISWPQQFIVTTLLLFEICQRNCFWFSFSGMGFNCVSVVVAIWWLKFQTKPCRRFSRFLSFEIRIASCQPSHHFIFAVVIERGLVFDREQVWPQIMGIENNSSWPAYSCEALRILVDWFKSWGIQVNWVAFLIWADYRFSRTVFIEWCNMTLDILLFNSIA